MRIRENTYTGAAHKGWFIAKHDKRETQNNKQKGQLAILKAKRLKLQFDCSDKDNECKKSGKYFS